MQDFSSKIPTSEPVNFHNVTHLAATVRAEFSGVGWMETTLPPGGSLQFCAFVGNVQLKVKYHTAVEFRTVHAGDQTEGF